MRVRTLRAFHFRNLEDASFEFDPGVNVFVGANAQGKTNLVEALHFLAQTKSFRTSQNKELIRWGENSMSVFADLECDLIDAQYEIGVALEDGEKSLYLNKDKLRSVTEYLGKLITVSFSPTDISLVKGPPSGRRRFIDKHLVDLLPKSIQNLINYQKALKHKLSLLKSGNAHRVALDPWNRILATEAAAISRARIDFIKMLEESARGILHRFAPDDPPLCLELDSNSFVQEPDVEEIFKKLSEAHDRECMTKSALVGPHRDDLLILLGKKDARAFSSQGQARSIVLSLVIAVLELIEKTRGEPPIILLDDVNSELDLERSQSFFELVLQRRRQIFVTGTDASVGHLQAPQGYSSFEVVEGVVRRA